MNRRPPGILLSQAIDGFLKFRVVEGLSDRTLTSYQDQLDRFRGHIGNLPIDDINTLHIEDFLYWLRTDCTPERINGKAKPLSAKTIYNYWVTLKSFFGWSHQREFFATNPMEAVPRPKFNEAPIDPFTQEEVERLLQACKYSWVVDTEGRVCVQGGGKRKSEGCRIMRMDETFTPPPASAITPEEWQQTPARVQIWIREIIAENKQLRETVEILQELVKRNSQNPSQPPSQDRPDQKPAREPSGLPHKRGGQPGHRGHHRSLVDEVDEMVIHKPISCAGCGALLLGDDPTPSRHQVTELPIVKPSVIEHQVHSLDCPCCEQRNRSELPPEVAASWFGPNAISLVGLLMGQYRLSRRQVTHLAAECFGITVAASTVVNQQQVISRDVSSPAGG